MLKGRKLNEPLIDRFRAKVKQGAPDACWLWQGAKAKGYGLIYIGRVNGQIRVTSAHRCAWELEHGPAANGLNVCHRCDTPLCVNVSHLFLGTQKENLADARRKGRLIDGLHKRKLSDADYREILLTSARGVDLAARFGVTETTIARIRMGVQGKRTVQRILQDQPRQSKAHRRVLHMLHEVLQPVPFRELPVVGDVR